MAQWRAEMRVGRLVVKSAVSMVVRMVQKLVDRKVVWRVALLADHSADQLAVLMAYRLVVLKELKTAA